MFPFDNDDEHVRAGPALVAMAILVMAVVFSGPSRAAPRALGDAEMSAVRGADGTLALPGAPGTITQREFDARGTTLWTGHH